MDQEALDGDSHGVHPGGTEGIEHPRLGGSLKLFISDTTRPHFHTQSLVQSHMTQMCLGNSKI